MKTKNSKLKHKKKNPKKSNLPSKSKSNSTSTLESLTTLSSSSCSSFDQPTLHSLSFPDSSSCLSLRDTFIHPTTKSNACVTPPPSSFASTIASATWLTPTSPTHVLSLEFNPTNSIHPPSTTPFTPISSTSIPLSSSSSSSLLSSYTQNTFPKANFSCWIPSSIPFPFPKDSSVFIENNESLERHASGAVTLNYSNLKSTLEQKAKDTPFSSFATREISASLSTLDSTSKSILGSELDSLTITATTSSSSSSSSNSNTPSLWMNQPNHFTEFVKKTFPLVCLCISMDTQEPHPSSLVIPCLTSSLTHFQTPMNAPSFPSELISKHLNFTPLTPPSTSLLSQNSWCFPSSTSLLQLLVVCRLFAECPLHTSLLQFHLSPSTMHSFNGVLPFMYLWDHVNLPTLHVYYDSSVTLSWFDSISFSTSFHLCLPTSSSSCSSSSWTHPSTTTFSTFPLHTSFVLLCDTIHSMEPLPWLLSWFPKLFEMNPHLMVYIWNTPCVAFDTFLHLFELTFPSNPLFQLTSLDPTSWFVPYLHPKLVPLVHPSNVLMYQISSCSSLVATNKI